MVRVTLAGQSVPRSRKRKARGGMRSDVDNQALLTDRRLGGITNGRTYYVPAASYLRTAGRLGWESLRLGM